MIYDLDGGHHPGAVAPVLNIHMNELLIHPVHDERFKYFISSDTVVTQICIICKRCNLLVKHKSPSFVQDLWQSDLTSRRTYVYKHDEHVCEVT